MALWTLVEQQRYKPITSLQEPRFKQLQVEVEANDIKQYLGFEFYHELIRNTSTYVTLLDGGTYTLSGVSYTFRGLKCMFAYLLYSRYVRESYIADTFSGLVQHNGDTFNRISSGELKDLENRYKEIAGSIWEETYRYLCTLNLPFFPQQTAQSTIKIDAL